jgi:predicted metalloprotease with PDZ domain
MHLALMMLRRLSSGASLGARDLIFLRRSTYTLALLGIAVMAQLSHAQAIHLAVDLTDAPRNRYHTKLIIPVKPGPFTLVYPKWIPGNHRPSGPIQNLTGLRLEAGGHSISWERDEVDMYAFHANVPTGTSELQVSFDAITEGGNAAGTGAQASSNVLGLNWNEVVLYPQGASSDAVQLAPSVKLPTGWKFGTALEVAHQSGDWVEFHPVPLTMLVDSPLIAGAHFHKIELTKPGETPVHVIDMVSESGAGLAMTLADEAAYRKLVAETGALFGARHYLHYHFLYTLSDQVVGRGLEHHQSSDNGVGERTLSDEDLHLLEVGLLPHEFVHSWNGKYRRPAGLATPNYQEPMRGDLLWVYEGLTEYLGDVLTARSGLWSAEQYREALAETAAMLDHRAGREWRPLEDTARSVQLLRLLGRSWQNWRRGLDYYPEGELIWLEVDTTVRQQTHGQKSLDDFCRLFFGPPSGPPKVVPYSFDDLVQALNQVAPYDWAKLLGEGVNQVQPRAPLEGIERGGWRLVYNEKPNVYIRAAEKSRNFQNYYYSLGFALNEKGEFLDVIPGSPSYDAGIGPGMKLVAINGRLWSKEVLKEAVQASKENHRSIELLVSNAEFVRSYSLDYQRGLQHPHLERSNGDDLLGQILKPLSQ